MIIKVVLVVAAMAAGRCFAERAAAPVRGPYPERSIYFATHFFNWYEEASDAEVEQYVEELAEWGLTGVAVWFDMHDFTGIDDPAAQRRIARLKFIFRTAKRLGLDRHLHFLANEGFKDSPVFDAGPTGYASILATCLGPRTGLQAGCRSSQ